MAKKPVVTAEERDPEEVYAEFLTKREADLAAMDEDFTKAPEPKEDELATADFVEARARADGEPIEDADGNPVDGAAGETADFDAAE